MPIITSLSTRFLGHPRLTNPTFVIRCEITLQCNSKFYHATLIEPEFATAWQNPSRSLLRWRGGSTDFSLCLSYVLLGDSVRTKLPRSFHPRAQYSTNLLEQLPQPRRIARSAAKARVHVKLRELLHRRSQSR